ncbi:MAG: hybrid sensor histidine kinase/response regulator [Spirochaetota bacterium]
MVEYDLSKDDKQQTWENKESTLRSRKLERVGQIACGFIHDFSNMLTVMSENIYMAAHENDPRKAKEYLYNTREAITRSRELIDRIYSYYNGSDVPLKQVGVSDLLSDFHKLITPIIPTHIKMVYRNNTKDKILYTFNETAVVQILFNLVINARDAIGRRGGFIEIGVQKSCAFRMKNPIIIPPGNSQRPFLCLWVTDSGPGMDTNLINKIFEPFFTTKQTGPVVGRGVGLSIVADIVRETGGGLGLHTRPGEGTTFMVLVPIKKQKALSGSDGENRAQVPHNVPDGLSGADCSETQWYTLNDLCKGSSRQVSEAEKKVIVVDDHDDIRLISKRLLEKRGYQVQVAESGEELLEMLNSNGYDLIVLDYHMPGLEGEWLVQKITEKTSTPIMVMTGWAVEELESLKKTNQVIEVIKKPLEVEQFTRTVSSVIG